MKLSVLMAKSHKEKEPPEKELHEKKLREAPETKRLFFQLDFNNLSESLGEEPVMNKAQDNPAG
ncbi:hypothetical protein ACFL4P_02885, partial [Gemmatimonadota bacterium]